MVNWKKIFIVLCLLILGIVLYSSGLVEYLTFEQLVEHKQTLLELVQSQFVLSAVLFVFIYIISIGLSFPGGSLLTLVGGLLFGAVLGTILVNIGATLGALIAFLLSRYLFGEYIEKKYAKQLVKLNQEIKKNGTNYLLTLRFFPIFPFFLINILTGALKAISIRKFIWTTSVGILPGSFVYAYAGFQLRTVDVVGDIVSPGVILAFVLLGVFALAPVVYKKVREGITKK